jgi:coniferyl-aldehyde dehydrogenase
MTDGIGGGEAARLMGLLEVLRRGFLAADPPDLAARRADLARLKAAVRARKGDFVRAAAEDFGRRRAEETVILDLGPVVQAAGYLARNLGRWMRPERRRVPVTLWPGRARVIRQPKGVVGIMAPWNYPFGLSLIPLATALAAGNRAMLKPSELAPASARAMAAMLAETFAPDEVTVVEGGPETGAAFAGLPFDHLVFTGSTAVGRKVMRAAAENLVPVTLELGGKSPAILGRDADFAKAARDIAWAKIANAGQTCIAPDHVLVHEDDAAAFVARLVAELERAFAGGARMTRIIDAAKARRLRALLAEAASGGAALHVIGRNAGQGCDGPPAVVTGLPPDCGLMREEIFGPLLPVVTYASLDAALAGIAEGPRPLALYYYGGAEGRARVLARSLSGNVTVNGVMTHYAVDSLPFGGVGASGIGAYHGREGFEAMSHARGVYDEPLRSLIPLGRTGGRFERLFAWYMMR